VQDAFFASGSLPRPLYILLQIIEYQVFLFFLKKKKKKKIFIF